MLALFENPSGKLTPAVSNNGGDTWTLVLPNGRTGDSTAFPVWELVDESIVNEADEMDPDAVPAELLALATRLHELPREKEALREQEVRDLLTALKPNGIARIGKRTFVRYMDGRYATVFRKQGGYKDWLANVSFDEAVAIALGTKKVMYWTGTSRFEVVAA